MWETNLGACTIIKFRVSDGAVLGTFSTGSFPRGVAFDGANLWVVNTGSSGAVTKQRASDGKVLATFAVGSYPQYAVFDGANVWVTNEGSNSTLENKVLLDEAVRGRGIKQRRGCNYDGHNEWQGPLSIDDLHDLLKI